MENTDEKTNDAAAEKADKAPAPVEVQSAEVNVVLIQDHKCSIGGKLYTFKKDAKTKVSRDVFNVLKNAGLVRITY